MSACFFNDTATTEIYTLSLHDALPISDIRDEGAVNKLVFDVVSQWGKIDILINNAVHDVNAKPTEQINWEDRKSTRLNSSHANISYAAFCLKKHRLELPPLPAREL